MYANIFSHSRLAGSGFFFFEKDYYRQFRTLQYALTYSGNRGEINLNIWKKSDKPKLSNANWKYLYKETKT